MTETVIKDKLLVIIKSKLKHFNGQVEFDWEGDLRLMGLDSMSTINLLMSIEDEFEIQFPESLTNEKTFRTGTGIFNAIREVVSN